MKILINKFKKNNFLNKNLIISILISWFPTLIIIGIWFLFIKKIKFNIKDISFFNKKKEDIKDKIKIKFSDIAGCDEAIEEIKELVDFLKNPNKYKELGAKLPKGILIVGQPGTGKTLLAKAIANESGISFFNISGSEFVEMFVGVGALRVRNIFNKARKSAPAIIFIDEIDSIGKHRSYNINNSNDEREQTLNQILIEMDGFNNNEDKSIIVIAATNRPDILDSALLRSGRFDKKIFIDLPNIYGRENILKIYTKNINIDENVNLLIIAKNTIGFTGADLSNLVNEAILLAIKNNRKIITMDDFDIAKDKIILGIEKKSLIINNIQKEIIAYHESGHVIISKMILYDDPIYKVSIIPRSNSLGFTLFTPEENILNINKTKLEDRICILYGGRIAEEIIYGKNNITTGSYNDIKEATLIAKNMIIKWGYSKKLGPILYDNDNYKISEETLKIIDKEILDLINKNIKRAKKILIKNIDILHNMKNELIKYETLNFKQIDNIINKKNNI